jgi:4-hydroxy-L-threonine phosphate dehydrogenase PdxA
MSATKPLIGITLGDYNGIGPEVIIKALSNPQIFLVLNLAYINLAAYSYSSTGPSYLNSGSDLFGYNYSLSD